VGKNDKRGGGGRSILIKPAGLLLYVVGLAWGRGPPNGLRKQTQRGTWDKRPIIGGNRPLVDLEKLIEGIQMRGLVSNFTQGVLKSGEFPIKTTNMGQGGTGAPKVTGHKKQNLFWRTSWELKENNKESWQASEEAKKKLHKWITIGDISAMGRCVWKRTGEVNSHGGTN